jgi:hypothetical protein
MTSWNYIELGLCLLLLLWLVVQEVKRRRQSLLAVRVAAILLAVAALAGLALPPGHYREVKAGPTIEPVKVESKVGREARDTVRAGIVAVDWQRRLEKGERLRVQGQWLGRKVKILLTGMGVVLDSADVTGEWQVTTVPAVVGKAVFGLVVLAGGDTVEREEVPVEVVGGKPLKIWVLAGSPDFENTFLMNWLGGQGDEVESRVRVSKGKYQISFVNMEKRPSDGFDLVIADSSEVTPDLLRQVEEKGLGLLIRVDGSVPVGRPGMRVLERDSAGKVVVGVVLAGAGKVIYSASNRSFDQWLAGRKEAYAAYWTMLLRQLGKTGASEEAWNWRPAMPRVEEPAVLELASDRREPEGLADDAAVYLAEDAALPWRWRGRYWPVSAGWQAVRLPGGDTSWGYAWDRGAWKGIKVESVVGVDKKGKEVKAWVAFPRWILYVVFLLSVLFLWVERKMGGMSG